MSENKIIQLQYPPGSYLEPYSWFTPSLPLEECVNRVEKALQTIDLLDKNIEIYYVFDNNAFFIRIYKSTQVVDSVLNFFKTKNSNKVTVEWQRRDGDPIYFSKLYANLVLKKFFDVIPKDQIPNRGFIYPPSIIKEKREKSLEEGKEEQKWIVKSMYYSYSMAVSGFMDVCKEGIQSLDECFRFTDIDEMWDSNFAIISGIIDKFYCLVTSKPKMTISCYQLMSILINNIIGKISDPKHLDQFKKKLSENIEKLDTVDFKNLPNNFFDKFGLIKTAKEFNKLKSFVSL